MEKNLITPPENIAPLYSCAQYKEYSLFHLIPSIFRLNARQFFYRGKMGWKMVAYTEKYLEYFKLTEIFPENLSGAESKIDSLFEYDDLVLRYDLGPDGYKLPRWVRAKRFDVWSEEFGKHLNDEFGNKLVITYKQII